MPAGATGTGAASTGRRRAIRSGRHWRRGYAVLGRRRFVGHGLAVLVLGVARELRAQGTSLLRFRPLVRVVAVPLEDMTTRWRSRQFVADAMTLDTAATPNQPIRITGMVVRTEAGDSTP